MTVPAHILRASLDDALEIVAAADTAKDLGTDALADIMVLDEPQRTRLLEVLRQCWALNAAMLNAAQRLSARMDELARIAHREQCEGNIAAALNVKALAAAMRPHLAVIADPDRDVTEYVFAVRELCALIDSTPVERLRGGGMRAALRGRHALLMQFVNGQAEPELTRQITRREHAPSAGIAGGEARASTVPSEGARLTTSFAVAS